MYSRILRLLKVSHSFIKILACLLGVVALKLASMMLTLMIAGVCIVFVLATLLCFGELIRYVF